MKAEPRWQAFFLCRKFFLLLTTTIFRSQDFVWKHEEDLDTIQMRAFRFRIGATEFNAPIDLVRVTAQLREIAARYEPLNIVTYQQSRAIADQVPNCNSWFKHSTSSFQLNVLLPNTLQNDVLAMLAMIIISLMFIPNPLCTLWIAIAMVTIDLGEYKSALVDI